MSAILNLLSKTYDAAVFPYTSNGSAIGVDKLQSLVLQAVVTDATPSNKTFTNTNVSVANDTVTITAHGFLTGIAVTLTSSGTLPGGLATATTYYLIKVDADTIKFATSLVNALAGTAVNITDTGTVAATQTVVVTALSGTLLVNGGMSSSGPWYPLCSSQVIAAGNFAFELESGSVASGFPFVCLGVTLASGEISVVQTVLGKGIS